MDDTYKDFKEDDLVWIELNKYPHWPVKIADPNRARKKPKISKSPLYVYAFGIHRLLWVSKDNVKAHSAAILEEAKSCKMTVTFKRAIEEIEKQYRDISKVSNAAQNADIIGEPEIKQATIRSSMDRKCKSKKTATKGKIKKENSSASATEFLRGIANIYENTDNENEIPRVIGEIYSRECERADNYQYDEAASTNIINRSEEHIQTPPIANVSECLMKKNIIPTTMKIGFIGLGLIAHGAVRNLLRTGHNITIWAHDNVLPTEFIEAGAHTAQSHFHLAQTCDVVFNCLTDEEAVKSLVFGDFNIMDGFVSSGNPESKGYIEMSSITPSLSDDIYIAAIARDIKYLEAPVIGSRTLADKGALLFIVAGDVELFGACKTAFRSMAETIYFLSEKIGSASVMCTIVSMLNSTTCAALAEAVAMSNRLNLSSSTFMELLVEGPLNCPLIKNKAMAMINSNFTADVSLGYQQDNLNRAINLGNSVGQSLLLSSTANEVFKRARLNGYSDHDVSAVIM